jgi:hypothetical protein
MAVADDKGSRVPTCRDYLDQSRDTCMMMYPAVASTSVRMNWPAGYFIGILFPQESCKNATANVLGALIELSPVIRPSEHNQSAGLMLADTLHGIVFQTGRPARARSGPARCGPTLCGPMGSSCRAVSGIVPDWRPRHGPMAVFSGRAGTTARLAHRAGVGLSGSAGPFPCHAVKGRRPADSGGAATRSRRNCDMEREGGRDIVNTKIW